MLFFLQSPSHCSSFWLTATELKKKVLNDKKMVIKNAEGNFFDALSWTISIPSTFPGVMQDLELPYMACIATRKVYYYKSDE